MVLRRGGGIPKKDFPRKHDVILRYGRTHRTFRPEMRDYGEHYNQSKTRATDLDGSRSVEYNPEGTPINDWWTDIKPLINWNSEYMGYKTQKPVALLERIIACSTNEGDLVLDPFAGCGTTMEAAEKLNRRWIGIDIAIHSVKRVARKRLKDKLSLVEGVDFELDGVPKTIEGAMDLWDRDKYHFQKWAVEQVDGFVSAKRTADGGIDGKLYFEIPEEENLQSMILEVKGGTNVGINVLRELKGVLDTNEALMAGLIVMHPLSDAKKRNFRRFMADVGEYVLKSSGVKFAKMQLLTVEEILRGERFVTPWLVGKSGQTLLPLGKGD